MTEHTVLHSTFTLERAYPAAPERVFAAWAEPAAKAGWFAGGGAEHALDFRVGGIETVLRAGAPGQPELRFESAYRDIVPGERIVYTSTLYADGDATTVSLTTVSFRADGDGTALALTEQGTFLDGAEPPEWRERGTSDWLDALGSALAAAG